MILWTYTAGERGVDCVCVCVGACVFLFVVVSERRVYYDMVVVVW